MTVQEIREFLEEHAAEKDVIELVSSMRGKLEPELVSAYLQTSEGKALVGPMMDQRVTDAIKTHDEKSKAKVDAAIKAGIAAEMLRLNPAETPEQKRLRELEEKDRRREEEWEREKLNSRIKELAFKEGIRPELFEGVVFSSEDGARLFAQRIKEGFEETKRTVANELAVGMPKPGMGAAARKAPDLAKMSQADLIRMEMDGELDNAMTG